MPARIRGRVIGSGIGLPVLPSSHTQACFSSSSTGTGTGYGKCVFELLGVGVGGSEGADLTIYDLRNGLSATMNSSPEGGAQMCRKPFWGSKMVRQK